MANSETIDLDRVIAEGETISIAPPNACNGERSTCATITVGIEGTINLIFPSLEEAPISGIKNVRNGPFSHGFKGQMIEKRYGVERVFLKVLRYEAEQQMDREHEMREKKFLKEAETHERLYNHPLNAEKGLITKFIGSGRFEELYEIIQRKGRKFKDLHYIVMEYIEGESADNLLHPKSPLSLAEQYRIIFQIASAIDIVHDAEYIHGDVKPHNVLVCGERNKAMLTDFGASKKISEPAPEFVEGTIHYVAPEVLVGDPQTVLSDIFAYGVMLYEMLEGKHPFAGSKQSQRYVSWALINNEIIPPKNRRGIESGLAEVAISCLQKNPARRPQSMKEVIYALAGCKVYEH
jgi:serine/threonine protein kinase